MSGAVLGVVAAMVAGSLGLIMMSVGWSSRKRLERSLDDVVAFDGFLGDVALGRPEERSDRHDVRSDEKVTQIAEDARKAAESLAALGSPLLVSSPLLDGRGLEIAQRMNPGIVPIVMDPGKLPPGFVFVEHFPDGKMVMHQTMPQKSSKVRRKPAQAAARRRRTPASGSTG